MSKDSKDWYEFTIGLYVEADTEEEAIEKLSPLLSLANDLDPEGDVQVESHGTFAASNILGKGYR